MSDFAPLPRGKGDQKPTQTKPQKAKKMFGIKNKQPKQKKQKKFAPKIPSMMKAKDYMTGCIVLCSVRAVEEDIIYFDLPGGVRGTLLFQEINDSYLERLRQAVSSDSNDFPSLDRFFHEGDFFSAAVISAGTKPVELSLRPSLLNIGLDIQNGAILSGAIKSIEDNGYIIDIGREEQNQFGFLPFRKGEKNGNKKYQIGQPLLFKVKNESSPIRLEVWDEEIKNAEDKPILPTKNCTAINFDQIRPYTVIDSVVSDFIPNGAVQLLVGGAFQGTCSKFSWVDGISKGDAVSARPILIDPAQKILWMSTIPRIVEGLKPSCLNVHIGEKIDSTVGRIRSGVGIECEAEVNSNKLRIFVDMESTKSDTALVSGDNYLVRVTERRPIDDLLLATDDPEIIALPIFGADDVEPGSVIDVEVTQLHPKFGIFVQLSPFLTGLCPSQYCDDTLKIKKGSKVQALVLSVEGGKPKLALKEKIVKSSLPRCLTLEDAEKFKENKTYTHVIVKKVAKAGLIVELYNNLVALIHSSQLPLENKSDITKHYQVGNVIKARISEIDGDKINCSVIGDDSDESKLTLGLKINVTVSGFTKDAVKVTLPSKYGQGFEAIIPNTHFADYTPLSKMIFNTLAIGQKIHHCILLRYPGVSAPALLSKKRSIYDNREQIPKETSQIKAGESYYGFVTGTQNFGSFVSFYGRASGLIHNKKLEIGDTIHAYVMKNEDNHLSLDNPTDYGESLVFLKNFVHDCSKFNAPLVIGSEFEIVEAPEPVGELFSYKINEEWTGISAIEAQPGEKLTTFYVDVLSNTILFDRLESEQSELEIDSNEPAHIVAVCEPIIVAKAKGNIILAPLINFNNRQNFTEFIKRGQEIPLKIVEKKQTAYYAIPQHLMKNEVGAAVQGTISAIDDIYATVQLLDGRTAKVHLSQLPEDSKQGSQITGQLLTEANHIYMILDSELPQRPEDFKKGQKVIGVVSKVFNDYMKLSLSPFVNGTISSLLLSTSDRSIASKELNQVYSIGDRIPGWVLETGDKFIKITGVDPLNPQSIHFGKIISIKNGDFAKVRLGFGDVRRLDVIDVSDEFTFDPLRKYKVGQVIDVCYIPQKDLNVSTRPSHFEGHFDDIEPDLTAGKVLKGYICHYLPSALLVRIARGVTARLPFGQIADNYIKNPTELFPCGSVIEVKIVSVKDKDIELTAKRSDIDGKLLTFEDLEVGQQYSGFITGVKERFGVFVSLRDYQNVSGLVHKSNLADRSPDEWQAFVGTHCQVEVEKIDSEKKRVNLKLVNIETKPEEEPEDEQDSDIEDDPELDEIDLNFEEAPEVHETPEELQKKLKLTEEQIAELEAKQLNPSAPKSVEEFTTLLISAPSSSYLWTKFIQFHFQNGDVEKAKETAERALTTIPIGETDEKKNVFIAYINMLVLTAADDMFLKECEGLVTKAAAIIEPKLMWTHFANFVTAHRKEHSEEVWKEALRKCKGSKSVWLKYLESMFREKETEKKILEKFKIARESLKDINEAKMFRLVEGFGVLEYKYGYIEHGRTIFNDLMQQRQKKFDFWNVYLDMEVKYGDERHARQLFDRVANMDWKPDRMRAIFKKWLNFEDSVKDNNPSEYAGRKKHIKDLASAYANTPQ